MRISWWLRPVWRLFHGRVRVWLEDRALVLPEGEVQYWGRRLGVPPEVIRQFWQECVREPLLRRWEGLR